MKTRFAQRIRAGLLLAGALVFTGCSKPGEQAAPSATDEAAPVPVQVETARRASMHSYVAAEAVLYPLKQANITPKISAPVAKFLVQRGDHVREGQLVAVLEDRDLVAAAQESRQLYDQARANYANTASAVMPDDLTKAKADAQSAKEALEAARRLYDHRVTLFNEGALAQKLVDDAKVALVAAQSQYDTAQQHLQSLQTVGRTEQLKSAEAQVAAAKAHYESAAAQVAYAEVRSPLTGVVADRPLNVGEMASAGSALLSVVDVSRVVARAAIPVHEAALITKGRAATITDGTGNSVDGKVSVVSPAVDPNTTTIQIWAEAPNPGEKLKLGSTVQVSIDAGEVPDAVVIPATALLSSDEGGDKVMIAGSDGRSHERAVKVGVRAGDDVQILDGVKPGEQVITVGALGLDDKVKVEITKPGADESGSGKETGEKEK
jgi:multidrug efflux pump subunit AcrA (membrane-fusion protein)